MVITLGLVELIYDKEEHKKRIKDGMGYPYGNIGTIFKVNGELLGGGCLKVRGGVYRNECDLYGFFGDILTGLAFLLDEGKSTRRDYYRTDVEQRGPIDQIKNPDLAYYTDLFFPFNRYVFELDKDKDELIIHYYNDPLSYTDCEEYKNKDSGIVRVPLKDFTKEIVKLAEDYLKLLRNSEIPENYKYCIKALGDNIKDVKKYYKERHGEEL
jgi:hypothetical protein